MDEQRWDDPLHIIKRHSHAEALTEHLQTLPSGPHYTVVCRGSTQGRDITHPAFVAALRSVFPGREVPEWGRARNPERLKVWCRLSDVFLVNSEWLPEDPTERIATLRLIRFCIAAEVAGIKA